MKKYLNSVEEVVKALKEGKKVCLYSKQNLSVEEIVKVFKEGKKITEVESRSVYQIIDGFLTEKQEKHGTLLNAVMPFNIDEYEYYTEEPEPLKFEVNRAYKTSNGEKVFLFKIESNDMPFLFIGEHGSSFWSYQNGKCVRDIGEEENDNDIVGYWEEEK